MQAAFQNLSQPVPSQLDRTEVIKSNLHPVFAKVFSLDYYFEEVQKLRFEVYDIHGTHSIGTRDDDFLGGVECTLGQVSRGRLRTDPSRRVALALTQMTPMSCEFCLVRAGASHVVGGIGGKYSRGCSSVHPWCDGVSGGGLSLVSMTQIPARCSTLLRSQGQRCVCPAFCR